MFLWYVRNYKNQSSSKALQILSAKASKRLLLQRVAPTAGQKLGSKSITCWSCYARVCPKTNIFFSAQTLLLAKTNALRHALDHTELDVLSSSKHHVYTVTIKENLITCPPSSNFSANITLVAWVLFKASSFNTTTHSLFLFPLLCYLKLFELLWSLEKLHRTTFT